MEQTCDLHIDGTPESVKAVFDYLKVDKTQRSDNSNDLFNVFEFPTHENSLCTGYTDKEFDVRLDAFYADPAHANNICFKSYRKNLFKFVQFLSEKFLSCRFKITWTEKYQGEEQLFVLLMEKSCAMYFQRGVSYSLAPNYEQFMKENGLTQYIADHSRTENEAV